MIQITGRFFGENGNKWGHILDIDNQPHLGASSAKKQIPINNILMEPNDQCPCIVPAHNADKSTDKLYLPFEGDRGLSLIISKAVLLSEDHKITDTKILSQIRRS